MKETKKDNRNGNRWTLKSRFCRRHLPCIKYKNASVRMKIGIKKTKLMTIGEFSNPTSKIDGQEIETVDRFTNLGSIVAVNDGTDADVKSRINKARHAFAVLKPIWKSRKTTFRPFNTNVKSLQLYGSECRKITYKLARMIQEFIHRKVQKI